MAPGQETSLAPPHVRTSGFKGQMYCIEEGTCHIFGTFGASDDLVPGTLCPLSPIVTSCTPHA